MAAKTFDDWWLEHSRSDMLRSWSSTVWNAAIRSLEGVQTQSGEAPNQQLKAEIAACVTELDCIQEACGRDELVQKVINRMRQLSAV